MYFEFIIDPMPDIEITTEWIFNNLEIIPPYKTAFGDIK